MHQTCREVFSGDRNRNQKNVVSYSCAECVIYLTYFRTPSTDKKTVKAACPYGSITSETNSFPVSKVLLLNFIMYINNTPCSLLRNGSSDLLSVYMY